MYEDETYTYPSIHFWLHLVVKHLSLRDLFNLRAVCHESYIVVTEYFRYMSDLDLSIVSERNRLTWEHFHLLTNYNCSFRRINLSNICCLNEILFHEILARQTRLRSIDLSCAYKVTNETINCLATNCTLVERLILRYCHWLSDESFRLITDRLEHLVELDVTCCWNIEDQSVQMLFVKRGSTLKHVCLSKLYSLSDWSIRSIATYGNRLSYLDISHCWRVTDHSIE